MTVIASHSWATTPKSCVTNSMPMPNSSVSDFSSLRICSCVVTSSAVVGSSAMTSAGLQASAPAIIRRWRWPPENWCG